jgi:hypothetical protein
MRHALTKSLLGAIGIVSRMAAVASLDGSAG